MGIRGRLPILCVAALLLASCGGPAGTTVGSAGATPPGVASQPSTLGGTPPSARPAGPGDSAASSPVPSAAVTPTGSAAVAGCVPAFGAGNSTWTVQVDGLARDALVHVPASLVRPWDRVPAVIALHGWSARAAEFAAYTGLSAEADRHGFVMVYPQGYGSPAEWHFPGNPSFFPIGEQDDVAFVEALLARLIGSGCIDPARVYVVGHSQGGGMVGYLACRLGDRLAGAAVGSGEFFELPCLPSRPVPVVAFHAVDDPVLPYAGGHIGGTPSDYPEVLAAEDVMAGWARNNGCTGGPLREGLADGVARLTWQACRAPVIFYRMPRGGHGWVGADGGASGTGLRATDVIWAFFASLAAR